MLTGLWVVMLHIPRYHILRKENQYLNLAQVLKVWSRDQLYHL